MRLVALDILTLLCCGIIAVALHGYSLVASNITLSDTTLVIASYLLCLNIIGGYETNREMISLRYAGEHVLAMCAVLVTAFIMTYGFSSYTQPIKPGRTVLLLTILLTTPLSLTYRYYFSMKEMRSSIAHFFYVVGTPEFFSYLQKACRKGGFRYPLRFIQAETEGGPGTDLQESAAFDPEPILRTILFDKKRQCQGVVIDLFNKEPDSPLTRLLLEINLHAVPVYPVETFMESYFYKIDLSHVTLAWALDGTFESDHQKAYGKMKSLIDGILGAVLLLAALPLMLLIALLIKLEDFGPALFTQVRIGRFEKPFLLYKFRTMSVAKEPDTQLYTETDDSRITKVGYILRLMRLDELPQFWNVVKGEMSIIGPRAEWSKLVEQYEQLIPFYHLRHIVKPGITGWAQVNYGYGASFEDTYEKLQYDLYYIKHYSPHMDASIILKTVYTILSASGR